ncbi:MAG: chromosomal replication initiator protein DnaA [Patescibacteria group bacterium]|nr:chromosomal replication initiator protein DnaA [Patescibacteria group bacterium]MDE1988176.1 chromosomal replication initiator protein DnaA [Patescibacteria group bacterium]MDE2218026.1 chromosomal replication initiator protein DnaA [Patescibacteria group bacterium]
MIENKKLWDSVLVEMELAISKANFSMWFKDTSITKQDDGIVYLNVPSVFVKDWLNNKYHKSILKSLRGFADYVRGVEYVVSKEGMIKKTENTGANNTQTINELPLQDFYINKEDNLNPRYTFDSFVVGPFNDLAYAASQAIIKQPTVYNPLFIYGNTGHGKTHLIQSIGNYVKTNNSNKKVYYLTSDKFAQDFINSLDKGKAEQFKEQYRKYDLLIIDDIQFFASKQKTQEEFFHLFNNLYDNSKQLVFSSDKHPNFIQGLEERVRSRFNAGMIVEIPAPDVESRTQILKKKSSVANLNLSGDVLDYLASSIEGNIRELEGVLNSILCQTQLKNKELNLNEVKNLIKNNIKPKKNISTKEVIKIITEFYNLEEGMIYKKTRKKEVVKPRQVIMYILREDFNISYPSIGDKLGGRDHTTVIHSCEKIKNDIKLDLSLNKEINQIRAMLL